MLGSGALYGQNFYTLTIINNTSAGEQVDIYAGGVVIYSTNMVANSTTTVNCLNGKPDNIRFGVLGDCSFQMPVNQASITCNDPTCTAPYCCNVNCTFYNLPLTSAMNVNPNPVPSTCNNGIGFYWNLTITIN